MAIIGEELRGYVQSQITARQTLHGSGGTGTIRTPHQINLLNSNTSWIKLASGVSISGSNRLTELGLDTSLIGMELAKNNILFSGISKLTKSGDQLIQQGGFLPREDNSSYTYGSFGFSPMPGIISADIKTLTRGSLKKATVRLIANNKQQFNIIDLLYMRLGYTVLLEWGNSIFTNNGSDKEVLGNTLIEDDFFESGGSNSYFKYLDNIESRRNKYNGNYDALLGKVSNFNWSFNPDGSYSIELTIISLGDVIESLKSNLSVNKEMNEFLKLIIPKIEAGGVEDIIDGGASGTVNNSKNVEIALKFFINEKKYSASKAIGIIAALMGESGPNLNPTAVNPKSKAYGLAQWLGNRAKNQILVAKNLGKNKSDLKAQLEFIHLELTPNSGYTDTIADNFFLKANTKEEYLAAMATYERWSYPVKLFYANGKSYNNVYPIILAEINKGNSPDSSLNIRIKYLADVKATWNKLYNP